MLSVLLCTLKDPLMFPAFCLSINITGAEPRSICVWRSEAQLHRADWGNALFPHRVRHAVTLRAAEPHRAAQSPGQCLSVHLLHVGQRSSERRRVSGSLAGFQFGHCLSVNVCHSCSDRYKRSALQLLTGTLAYKRKHGSCTLIH